MNNINKYIDSVLLSISDETYREFHKMLIPTVSSGKVIGVRTPVLRRFARNFGKTEQALCFMHSLPHTSYDAYNLHGFLIEQVKDFKQCVRALDEFLPYVDNWATCDMTSPKILSARPDELIVHIGRWIGSEHTYEVRFAIVCLMRYFLDSYFRKEVLDMVAAVKSDEYYINMARAWFFATALAKQWDSTIRLIEDNRLDLFTHNKTIRKAVESYRISDTKKSFLKTLLRK